MCVLSSLTSEFGQKSSKITQNTMPTLFATEKQSLIKLYPSIWAFILNDVVDTDNAVNNNHFPLVKYIGPLVYLYNERTNRDNICAGETIHLLVFVASSSPHRHTAIFLLLFRRIRIYGNGTHSCVFNGMSYMPCVRHLILWNETFDYYYISVGS